jgi:hypothetical protein
MRLIISVLGVFAFVIPTMAQSKFGLTCSGDACVQIDEKAADRMANAKSICASGDSGFYLVFVARYPIFLRPPEVRSSPTVLPADVGSHSGAPPVSVSNNSAHK